MEREKRASGGEGRESRMGDEDREMALESGSSSSSSSG